MAEDSENSERENHLIVPPRPVLAHGPRKEEILDLSLLLASQEIKHWIEFDGREFFLSLDQNDFEAASELIRIYQSENRGFLDQPIQLGQLQLYLAPLLFLALPAGSYFLVESQPWAGWWHTRGSAEARAILSGEWWRCLTATTLHADDLHLISNLVSGYFILNLLNHRLGIGSIMLLASLGGAAANFAVAWITGPQHNSIGFSSVVFCALGILGSIETFFLPRKGDRSLRRLSPLIAALFMAIMVGLGENADVKVHFIGFGIGSLLGILSQFFPKKTIRPAWQAGFIGFTFGLYALGWALAARS